jgi:hypothetical protein
MAEQQADIALAGGKRRDLDARDVEAVGEILAELALPRQLMQIRLGRGDDLDVDRKLRHWSRAVR